MSNPIRFFIRALAVMALSAPAIGQMKMAQAIGELQTAAANREAQPQPQAPSPSREVLGEGDAIRITVFQNPDLTTETRISDTGTISFPLIGEVAIAGLTPVAAEARIAQRLAAGNFMTRPQVSLNVTRVRSR